MRDHRRVIVVTMEPVLPTSSPVPPGKGVRVARTLRALGHEVTVTGIGSGVTEPHPGPVRDWAGLLAVYRGLLARGAEGVALCGGLPPGVPVGGYAELIREARAAGVYVALDAYGPALRRGLGARPDLVVQDAAGLAALTGFAEPVRAARDAYKRGARAVAAPLGPGGAGMLALAEEGGWHAAPPRHARGLGATATDHALAGLLSGAVTGLPWPERLARAVALTESPGPPPGGGYDPGRYAEVLSRVVVEPLATS
ncbi:1-phosphofructokinase [Streptomyces sp. NPDC021224]|uniref:1-phosphofructokinase n=1 Tax=unclassified Streptomyces TaxID=2593676 RepID=UPI0037AFAB7F